MLFLESDAILIPLLIFSLSLMDGNLKFRLLCLDFVLFLVAFFGEA